MFTAQNEVHYTIIFASASVILSISSSSSSLCSSSLLSLSSPSVPTCSSVVEAVGVANKLARITEQQKITYYHLPEQWAKNSPLADEGHSSQEGCRFAVAAYEGGHLPGDAASVRPSGEQQM